MLYQKLLSGVAPYYLDFSGGGPFELHCHPEIELNYCLKGSYNIIIDQKEYTLNEGDLAVVNPMLPHEMGKKYTYDSLRLTIEMGPSLLGEHFNPLVSINPDNFVFSLKNNTHNSTCNELKYLLEETADILKSKPPFYELSARGNIYKISAVLLRIFTESSNKSDNAIKSLIDIEKIGRAINIIYSHFDEKLNLDTVSEICGYSKSYFCKTFKNITGESFHSMLNRHRVEVACLKLKELDISIEEIALSVGFNDSKSFCRVFKKFTGKNAGEYKKELNKT